MKVLQINGVYPNGSTGVIVHDLKLIQENNDIEAYIAYGSGTLKNKYVYPMQNSLCLKINILRTRFFGKHGFYNKYVTKKLINWIKVVDPDVIHLHNLHGHYLNIDILFCYLKKFNKPVVWTIHDCWPMTGHCAHFDFIGCQKWKTGCNNCPLQHSYPKSYIFDRSKTSWEDKRKAFIGLKRLIIVTPSEWLSDIIKHSYLNEYPVKVINNGIDIDAFKPTLSSLRQKLGLDNEFVVLGMANKWLQQENQGVVEYLINRLPDDVRIVLIGNSNICKTYKNIISIPFIKNHNTLAEYYSLADVFVNITLEDTFPTVNLEALACGTPLITYDTGGSTECVNCNTGILVPQLDKESLFDAIIKIKDIGKSSYTKDCVAYARENYDKHKQFSKYINLYRHT